MKKTVRIIIALLTLCLVFALPTFAAETSTASIPGIAAASLSFDGGVHMYFYLYVGEDAPAADVDYGMIFWTAKQAEGDYTYEKATAAGAPAKVVDKTKAKDDIYSKHPVKVFTYSVSDTCMTDIVYAQGYMQKADGSGYEYSTVMPYSVQTYAIRKLGIVSTKGTTDSNVSENAYFRNMVQALLEYGTAAQYYHDYRTDDLADMIFYWTKDADLTYEDNGDGTCSVKGFGELSDVVIPKIALTGDCAGKTVTGIKENALKDSAATLKSVSVPVTVTSIDVTELEECTKLTSARIPSSSVSGKEHKLTVNVTPAAGVISSTAGGSVAENVVGSAAVAKVTKLEKSVGSGSRVSLTAAANKYYTFDGWYNAAGTQLSTEPNYSCIVADDLTLEARFTPMVTCGDETSVTSELSYNGKAAVIMKDYIDIGGTAWSKITDETILSKLTYKWFAKDGSELPEDATKDDITLDGNKYMLYASATSSGLQSREVGINEIVGPCTVGEYKLVVSYDGAEKLTVNVEIKENTFSKISTVDQFTTTNNTGTMFESMDYYTIVGVGEGGKLYVMQMPKDGSKVEAGTTVVEAEAREVTADANGVISLGGELDFVFAMMRYYNADTIYYPSTSQVRENLLVDFTTGYYGAFWEGSAGAASMSKAIRRTGYVSLSGGKITREKGLIQDIDHYGHLTLFDADTGAVTIYEPRKGQTANNALRLVKDGEKYVFTSVPADTDTRDSYLIYIYKRGDKVEESGKGDDKGELKGTVEFYGKLDKAWDGKPVSFNANDVSVKLESGEDIGSLIKTKSVRFYFTDAEDSFVGDYAWASDDGTVEGPADVGRYKLYIEVNEPIDGKENWVSAKLCGFEIYKSAE